MAGGVGGRATGGFMPTRGGTGRVGVGPSTRVLVGLGRKLETVKTSGLGR